MKDQALWVGVDPGKGGALAVLRDCGSCVAHYMVRTVGRGTRSRVDMHALKEWWAEVARLEHHAPRVTIAIERVSSMPTDSAKSAFSFGRALGALEAWGEVAGFRRVDILPRDWQNLFLRGLPRGNYKDRKASSALAAHDRFPELRSTLRLKKNFDVADAALIADTARLIERNRSESNALPPMGV